MFGRRRPPRSRRGSATRSSGSSRGALETVVLEPMPVRAKARDPVAASRARLLDLAGEWVVTILAIRQAPELSDAALLRTRALELKSRLEDQARGGGFSAADAEEAVYALVSFFDETVLRARGAARDAWIGRPLQMELFGQNVAGEEFFNRLERLRREREAHVESLEVYLACLAFGFQGRYALGGPDKLHALISAVEADVTAVRGTARGPLAPRALHRETLAETPAAGVPIWLSLAVFVPAILLVWIILASISHLGASGAAAELRSLLR